jgi:hypothetical protein
LDLAVVEYGGTGHGALGIYLGDGKGSFGRSATYELGIEPVSVAVADFNGDGFLDVAVTNELGFGNGGQSGSVMVFFGDGDGTLDKPTVYQLPGKPYGVASGDLNGDLHPDLAVVEDTGGVVDILLNNGSGKFKKTGVYKVGGEPVSVCISDLNHDGIPDLVIPVVQAVAVLLGKGGGKFKKAVQYSTSGISNNTNPVAVVVADFNLDGNPDIVAVLTSGHSALFYGKGNGTFRPAVPIQGTGGGYGLATGDFNGDGAPDLAIDSPPGIVVLIDAQ